MAKVIRPVAEATRYADIGQTLAWFIGGFDRKWPLAGDFEINPNNPIRKPAGYLHDMLPGLVSAYVNAAQDKATELGEDPETFNYSTWLDEQHEAAKQATEAAERAAAEAAERAARIQDWFKWRPMEDDDEVGYSTYEHRHISNVKPDSRGESRPVATREYDIEDGVFWIGSDAHKALKKLSSDLPGWHQKLVPPAEFWPVIETFDPEALAFRPQDNDNKGN